MGAIVAIDCQVVKQQIASGFGYDYWRMEAKEIMGEILSALMASSPKYRDRQSLASKSGVSARTIGSMMKGKGNPTLKSIVAVAQVFNLEAWELLIDHAQTRRKLITRILDADAVPDSSVERAGFSKLPKERTK